MKTVVYKELTPELMREWTSLWHSNKQIASAFNSPTWLIAATHAFGHRDIRIVTVYDDGTLKAVCALTRYTMYGVPVYAAPALEFCDKTSILVNWNDWPVVSTLSDELKKLGVVYLTECYEEMANKLCHAAERNSIMFQDDENPYISFADGLTGDASPDVLKRISKRIAKSPEPVEMIHSVTDHSQSLKEAFDIEVISTKHDQGKSVFQREEARMFYETLATLDPSLIHGSVMKIGEKSVGYSLDFLANGVYQGSQKAYVRGYEYFQPGKYIIIKLLEWNHENGRPGFDLGRGNDGFKKQFTQKVRPLYTVILTNRKTVGMYLSHVKTMRERTYDAVISQPKLYKAFKSVKNVLGFT